MAQGIQPCRCRTRTWISAIRIGEHGNARLTGSRRPQLRRTLRSIFLALMDCGKRSCVVLPSEWVGRV